MLCLKESLCTSVFPALPKSFHFPLNLTCSVTDCSAEHWFLDSLQCKIRSVQQRKRNSWMSTEQWEQTARGPGLFFPFLFYLSNGIHSLCVHSPSTLYHHITNAAFPAAWGCPAFSVRLFFLPFNKLIQNSCRTISDGEGRRWKSGRG